MAPRLDLEEFLPLSLPFFFLVEKWSRAINGRIISRASSAGEIRRIPRPRPYIREDPPVSVVIRPQVGLRVFV